jgi:hypothetical protein
LNLFLRKGFPVLVVRTAFLAGLSADVIPVEEPLGEERVHHHYELIINIIM